MSLTLENKSKWVGPSVGIYWSTMGKSATNPACIFSSKATHRRIFYLLLLLLQLMHRTIQAAGICFRREWINPWHDLRIKVWARCWHWQIFNLGKREEKNNIIIKRCIVEYNTQCVRELNYSYSGYWLLAILAMYVSESPNNWSFVALVLWMKYIPT